MNSNTGATYINIAAALAAGEPLGELVEISGPPEVIERISAAVAARHRQHDARKARRKNQRAARRRNR